MPRYAMLILPSANRVYAGAAADLVRAELAAFSAGALSGSLSDATASDRGGVPYLEFTAPQLTECAIAFLAKHQTSPARRWIASSRSSTRCAVAARR